MGKTSAKERILTAAVTLFGEKGYTATTTREIAEKAGVSEVTIFRHFGNKEQLFKEGIIVKTPPLMELTGDIEQDFITLGTGYMKMNTPKVNHIWATLMEARQNKEMNHLLNELNMYLINHLANHLQNLHQQNKIPFNDFTAIAAMFYGQLFSYFISMIALENDKLNVTSESHVALCAAMYSNYVKNPSLILEK